MKKIGIITITDYNNYGNRLQNYAVQEVLRSLGFSVNTIPNSVSVKSSNHFVPLTRLNKLKSMSIGDIYNKISSKLIKKHYENHIRSKRINTFKDFSINHITETEYSITSENIPNHISEEYDFFIVGSDQTWNPVFRYGASFDFLTFAPKDKRIAYAPSFGINEIPQEYIERYKLWISEIRSLSVREIAGAKIIKNLTDREATVLVDPTLMLDKNKWLSISEASPNKPKEKYLLTYFLGPISLENKRKIKQIAKKNNFVVVSLNDIYDSKTYVSNPSEFIDFIHSASILCTDSFHGAVFSILFEKPFIVFERVSNVPSMNSRIETLLSTFKFKDRLDVNLINNKDFLEIDYSHVPPILEKERKKTITYLEQALEVKGYLNVQ